MNTLLSIVAFATLVFSAGVAVLVVTSGLASLAMLVVAMFRPVEAPPAG